MKAEELISILGVCARLKTNTRHCWTDGERKESVADHSWRAALIAMLISHEPEFADADMNKVIRMCLIHDLGEAFTGDIPTFLKTSSDEEKEDGFFERWIKDMPMEVAQEWSSLLDELLALETKEAKIYKAIDKMEAVISHNEGDIATWLPLEYDLQLTYGRENVQFSPFFRQLKDAIDVWTKQKIEKEGRSL